MQKLACLLLPCTAALHAGRTTAPIILRGFARAAAAGTGGDKLQRIERIIANRGVGSRKEVAQLIRAGRVKVGGKVILSGADRFPLSTAVDIEGMGEVVGVPLLAVYHKPVGVVSTMADNWNRASLSELQLEYGFLKTMHPVGRLDLDTSGLLLFSSDGGLTQMLLHPSTGVDRVYEALVVGNVDFDQLGATLRAGVTTTEGTFSANLLEAGASDELVPLSVVVPPPLLDDGEGEDEGEEGELKVATSVNPAFVVSPADGEQLVRTSRVVLSVTEGKYRMVRRVLHNAGHSVLRLHRQSYGSCRLGDLEEGEVRTCTAEEASWARSLLKAKAKARDRGEQRVVATVAEVRRPGGGGRG